MKLLALPLAVSLVSLAHAHATVFGVFVNNEFQGDGRNVYIRSPPNNSPVKDVSSPDINCNANNVAVPQSVSVNAGDTVDFEWFHDNRNDDIIDPTHQGPVLVYIADAATNGNGPVWTKLAEDGFSNGEFAVARLIRNGGRHSVVLPAGLAPGDYLLRAEIIALHEADTNFAENPARGSQHYPSCVQITVENGGSVVPDQGFDFTVGYTPSTPGILFNIFQTVTEYPIPGPPVFSATGAGAAPAQGAAPVQGVAPVQGAAPAQGGNGNGNNNNGGANRGQNRRNRNQNRRNRGQNRKRSIRWAAY